MPMRIEEKDKLQGPAAAPLKYLEDRFFPTVADKVFIFCGVAWMAVGMSLALLIITVGMNSTVR